MAVMAECFQILLMVVAPLAVAHTFSRDDVVDFEFDSVCLAHHTPMAIAL